MAEHLVQQLSVHISYPYLSRSPSLLPSLPPSFPRRKPTSFFLSPIPVRRSSVRPVSERVVECAVRTVRWLFGRSSVIRLKS